MHLIMSLPVAAVLIITPNIAHAEPVSVDDLLKEVKSTLLMVSRNPDNKKYLPPFKSATLSLSVSKTKEVGGKVKLVIVEFGKKMSVEGSSGLSITMTPPPAGAAVSVANDSAATLLASAINEASASEAVRSAKNGQPPLIVSEVKASVKFSVTKNGSGGISLAFGPVEIGGDGAKATEGVQEIEITYGS